MYGFSSYPNPVNDILLGPLHSIHMENGNLIDPSYFFEPSYTKEQRTKDVHAHYTELTKFERKARAALRNDKFGPYISDCLILYCDALDQPNISDSFLRLWALLERLTQTGHDNYDTTLRRASFLIRDHKIAKYILETLRRRRNNAVHDNDKEAINHDLLYDIKWFVEIALKFYLFWAHKNLNDLGEAKDILDHPKDIGDLDRKKRLLALAIGRRTP